MIPPAAATDKPTPVPTVERVAVVLVNALTDPEILDEFSRDYPTERAKVVLISPAVEDTELHHALGDSDTARREAKRRLDISQAALRNRGVPAFGLIGGSDPVGATAEVLRQFPADEVLIVAHCREQERWYENGLLDRARERLRTPVSMIAMRHDLDGVGHLDGVHGNPGTGTPSPRNETVPRFREGDLAGLAVAILGTIATIVLSVAAPGISSVASFAEIPIAVGISLLTLLHIAGVLLPESLEERGRWQRRCRTLSLVATPIAVVSSLALSTIPS